MVWLREPSDVELENIDAGVITPYYDSDLGYFVMSQAVNSLQQNIELINDDCSTFSIQCKQNTCPSSLRILLNNLRLISGEVRRR